VTGLKETATKFLPEFAPTLNNGLFDPVAIAKLLFENPLRKVSWNHGKVLAVNGRVVMTGGGNYWNAYAAKQEAHTDHTIVDHQARIVGDAAVSAHKWVDYFWR
jgi:phosphatidylserine/phosphatidylglycerophosphate/cardiolipin synthase-like enzyme